ncbi:HAD hydrolase-like protein [Rhodospirillaceae bacterium KN72]|uniref:phosphoglycolate phosphatase n=1 Tax=Pacificispira spongiicola TaxID=2729598 RepID=A0A7Y0E2E3_9PROT|nr:HAD hydrolase-like protein [Pacificispira spongiicola]NMM45985.1 HAD hydrolase-like protein [Pacificispira spongiicola]
MSESPILIPPITVVYDWDNTLVDTWPVIHAAMNHLFRYMDMPEWRLEETKARVRKSMRDTFPEMFGNRWEEARDEFYSAFEALHLDALKPLDGAEALLSSLTDSGVPQSVVSNKQGPFLRKEAGHLNWDRHFHALVGAGDAPRDKPAPDPILLALSGLDVTPGPAVYFVGDSSVDMEIAHATGLTPILIHPEPDFPGEFAQFPPARHFSSLAAFKDFLTAQRV